MNSILQFLAAPSNFLPHGYCFLRDPGLIALHVASDAIIALAYFMIPFVLVYFLRRMTVRISFDWAIALFAAFIVLCGTGHVLDIITVWYPIYYVQGGVRALTAMVSLATALAIIPLVPRLLSMKSPEELQAANDRLRAEVQAREAAEQELHRSLGDLNRAVQELEQFAYITSHDLQAPLRNIAGFSQLLSRRYRERLDGDALEFLTFIDQGVRQMQSLIKDLLALSRVGRTQGRAEKRPLNEAVRQALTALRTEIEQKQARITVDELPEVQAEQTLVTQLFQNLIGNAIKFHKPDAPPEVHVSAVAEPGAVHIEVRDRGIGIPPDQLENVFAVFRRLHNADEYEGTGIGLALCRKIVQHHRGQIWAESGPEGAVFHVRLPSQAPAASTVAPTLLPDVPILAGA
jgi:signal transduction histidine kinase